MLLHFRAITHAGYYRAWGGGSCGHVGIPGPQVGMGKAATADWWLSIGGAFLGVRAVAAPPATTISRAKMRIASFMAG